MNDFDFSLYDNEDFSEPIKLKNKSKKIAPPKEEFDFSEYEPEQLKESSFLENVADYGKTFLKGTVEGLGRLGRIMGPLPSHKSTEEQLQELTQALNEYLPTDEGYIQSSLRRGLREAPTMLGFPGGATAQTAVRTGLAGFAGEGAKELGLPEWAQTAAELTVFMGPDLTKKLIESGSNKELIKAARELGISDEALAPLLNSEFKQKWLSKISPRRGKTQAALEKSKSELHEVYGKLQESEAAKNILTESSSLDLIGKLDEKLFEMPSGVRGKIRQDYEDLLSRPITGESLMNFWADINFEMGKNSKQLSLLKEPIKKALNEISPKLAKEFETVNTLKSKYHKIVQRLEPNLKTDIISAAKSLGILGGLITGNYGLISQFAMPYALGKISQQMLINPRFHQLSNKMVDSLIQNKFGISKKVGDIFAKEMEKISPDAARQIEDLDIEDFEKFMDLK